MDWKSPLIWDPSIIYRSGLVIVGMEVDWKRNKRSDVARKRRRRGDGHLDI